MVSSEGFIAAALKPERFSNFLAGLQQVGFAVVIVIAVREQADFLFSLYSELVCRHQFSLDFNHYLGEAINSQEVTYRHWRFPLDYAGLLEHLKAYGVEVRTLAYNQEARAGGWAASWLACLDLDSSQLPPPPQLNPSISAWELVRSLHRNQHGLITCSIESMLTAAEQIKPRLPRYRTDEMEALQRAFKPCNAALKRDWGVCLECCPATLEPNLGEWTASTLLSQDFQTLLRTMADRDWTSRTQQRLQALWKRRASR